MNLAGLTRIGMICLTATLTTSCVPGLSGGAGDGSCPDPKDELVDLCTTIDAPPMSWIDDDALACMPTNFKRWLGKTDDKITELCY